MSYLQILNISYLCLLVSLVALFLALRENILNRCKKCLSKRVVTKEHTEWEKGSIYFDGFRGIRTTSKECCKCGNVELIERVGLRKSPLYGSITVAGPL
jgi:hypothetical protein